MPIYEFRCSSCRHKFEKLCQLGETGENLKCPRCGAPKPNKIMSSFRADSADSLRGSRGDSCTTCTSRNCSACR
ncbi:putative FmdB family regulatory protein [Desulfohalotomaculum tongense]|uniref:FmdB family zinc ribbon protein n=1 Tax=Desulforadius tongensis TaxID=1216062 RepID=UPI001956A6B8|nr:zinc ribbon domain-containing protein [Desulforadius tongensis]MBM7855232.1 putative FmdB family regulatory protein [Desulforadius tongensis]